jgi:cytochrome c biogenesis protein ResB
MVEGPKTKQPVDILVDKNNPNMAKQIMVDGKNIMLDLVLKFADTILIKLDKFVMETYPGSNSPSAYESHVQIIENGKQTPYKIYMNHVLNHGGYRFFQAGFDPDRKGTHLSVNHDFWELYYLCRIYFLIPWTFRFIVLERNSFLAIKQNAERY